MLPKLTFNPRIKVPTRFSNTTLNRPKTGMRVISSKSLAASMRNNFTNSAQDYMNYDDEIFDKKNRFIIPRSG